MGFGRRIDGDPFVDRIGEGVEVDAFLLEVREQLLEVSERSQLGLHRCSEGVGEIRVGDDAPGDVIPAVPRPSGQLVDDRAQVLRIDRFEDLHAVGQQVLELRPHMSVLDRVSIREIGPVGARVVLEINVFGAERGLELDLQLGVGGHLVLGLDLQLEASVPVHELDARHRTDVHALRADVGPLEELLSARSRSAVT